MLITSHGSFSSKSMIKHVNKVGELVKLKVQKSLNWCKKCCMCSTIVKLKVDLELHY